MTMADLKLINVRHSKSKSDAQCISEITLVSGLLWQQQLSDSSEVPGSNMKAIIKLVLVSL